MWEHRDEIDAEVLAHVDRPVLMRDPPIEQCSFCGQPTIFGAYVRHDPADVPYPAIKTDG